MTTDHATLTDKEMLWGFRFWWPHRHGVNAGGIRQILRNYIRNMRRRPAFSRVSASTP